MKGRGYGKEKGRKREIKEIWAREGKEKRNEEEYGNEKGRKWKKGNMGRRREGKEE